MPRKKPLDVETLWRLERVGLPTLSPDGRAAVCSVTTYSMEENKSRTSLWLLPTDSTSPRKLTSAGEKDGNPAWSPKGERIAFLARREQDGKKDKEAQLYVIAAAGGEAERKSDFAPGVDDFKWMPDGRRIVFVSWVWPDVKGARAQAKRHKEFSERKESAYVTSDAHYRHWDHNLPMGRVPHLLMLDVETGRITDLFEGTEHELPRMDTCAAHFDISPDGRRIAFVTDPAPRKRADNFLTLFELDVKARRFSPLTNDPRWNYDAPRYSPDGSSLACVAAHVGRRHTMPNRLALRRPDGSWRVIERDVDLDVEAPLRWSRDGASILFAAQQRGRRHLWRHEVRTRRLELALQGGWVQGFDVVRPSTGSGRTDVSVPVRSSTGSGRTDVSVPVRSSTGSGRTDVSVPVRPELVEGRAEEILVVAVDSASNPVQIHAVRGGSTRRLERFNDKVMAGVRFGETREVSVKGALGDDIQVFLTFPPRFNPRRKHPVLQVIHGGPYAASGDTWGYRWNPHVFASRGHVVVQVNYHGSSGFGHAFTHSIMGRMGALEFRDIEAATDWVLKQRWADRRRVFASGGSYGGFMVAWMNGHAPPGRYRAYVCHAGVFDRVATFSADSYCHRPKDLGAWYWKDPRKVSAQSPHTYAHRMSTPTLITHGANDYRVPDTNGLAYYNTLLARGVPTRLVWFPDENHWVLKPRNSRLWYGEFFDWLGAHDIA